MKKIPVRSINVPSHESGSSGFQIRTLQSLMGRKDMVQELHRHEYYYLLAIEKGKGTHEIDFVSYPVKNNSVFFMRPGQVHQLILKAGCIGYMMQFNADFYFPSDKSLSQSLRNAGTTTCYQLDSRSNGRIHSVLNLISEENADRYEGYETAIKANLGILFVELNRKRKDRSNVTKNYAFDRLAEFTELLQANMNSHKQVSEYADLMNLSVYQLNAITKETSGKTCSELINEHIILEAKRYLLATSNQINQIAFHLGYEDPSYFIRFFKKHTGLSPEAFRQKSK